MGEEIKVINNKHAHNLTDYVEHYKAKFHERLAEYNAVGDLDWDAKSWHFGEKGVAWLKETKDHGFKWDEVSNRVKGLSKMEISTDFQDFMRAYHMHQVGTSSGLPSGSTLDKPLQIMKRWYWEMVTKTGQTHPMYLTADIIHASMDRHKANSTSAPNVSDYCDVAVSIINLLRRYDLFMVNIEIENKHPCRNASVATKEMKKAAELNPDETPDSKLISIRAFMAVIELMALAENDYQRIFYNMLLLCIICGFRFQEIMALEMDSLVKREITNDSKRQHAIDQGWPTYKLGIEYLGAKKAGWRIHWLAPTSYPVVEMIYKQVEELTSGIRDTVKGFRESDFTNFLPSKIFELSEEQIECRDLDGLMFTGTGGKRNVLYKSICVSMEKYTGYKPIVSTEKRQFNTKRFYFLKEQLNDYVYQRYAKSKNFTKGHQCVLSLKDSGDWEHFNYEDLMFIMPEGAFGIGRDFVSLQNIVPLDEHSVEAWLGGADNRKSLFDYFNLFEDDGSRIQLKKHVPRHNINTFLAIAGVTDHIQAILMGRVDITQNKHYQHQAQSQSYQAASLAMTMLEKAYDEGKKALEKERQLSLFDDNGEPASCPEPSVPQVQEPLKTEVSRRMAALAKSTMPTKNTGVANVKASTSMAINPNLSVEHNLKQNMQTFGETTAEVAHYMEGAISDDFLPELKVVHDKFVEQGMSEKAKELLERHAKLHPLGLGACTRDIARWGCPHAVKCQSGLPCGYFTLTGRLGEAEEVSRRLTIKQEEVIVLQKLAEDNPNFDLALEEQKEALIVLEALKVESIKTQSAKKLVDIMSDDQDNPLARIMARINEQMLIGKHPKTVADLFFIEQKRLERDAKQEEENNG
ncbi:hypothetical protein OPW04_24440 [Vibrio europaeus]|uniref:hypothetical protein n=1 Tax=Vibrio europaeus TaxID=300876 RepID=UPI00233EA73A|nr:hypothetical protein [Vibrio europaeus]MDC5806393.1 hypothetical protein [Vibrio europaeus]MDC5807782.1 hypothetical protein [Vibrio europaeus]MDC5808002.1 hypothetical protein [Vibrio europaeus]MDC5830828.1 hypothetical protein [Vibrio europaeus]MDC5830898.1 hypothetical protein [Vibrio europaeus]